jgi:IclR family KDG regulon transcriptional repressor
MKKNGQVKPTYFVQSVDRTIDILECFTFKNKKRTLPEIVKLTRLNRTTVIRLLSHLMSRDFVKYDDRDRTYQLGLKMLELGGVAISSISLRQIAAPHLTRLRDELGHTIMLGVRQDDDLMYIDKRDGKGGALIVTSEIGRRRPLHFGMLGMILMAYLPREEQEYLLKKDPLQPYTHATITNKKVFLATLTEIREKGYFMGREEAFEGVGGISVPIRDYQNNVVAALGFTMMVSMFDRPGVEEKTLEKVQEAALAISRDLGYSPG